MNRASGTDGEPLLLDHEGHPHPEQRASQRQELGEAPPRGVAEGFLAEHPEEGGQMVEDIADPCHMPSR